ncbi:hypothetical protein DSECCO2_358340 [anaerobic digester metagenome]|nr:thioesterase family protein [Clostridiaceae bacterium HFYG-1003]
MGLEAGMKHTTQITAAPQHSAAALGSGDLEVLGTPALIAFLESNCKDSVRSFLPEGSTTVGIHLNFDHLKASPIGAQITCTSEVTEVKGRLIHFRIQAESGEHIIGEGTHIRAVVDRERFLAGLNH